MEYLETLPAEHTHCAELVVEAFHHALKDYGATRHEPWKKAYLKRLRLRLRHFGELGLGALFNFRHRQVLGVAGEAPAVTERVQYGPHAISPEHVVDRHLDLGAGRNRGPERLIDVVDIDVKTDRRTAHGFRAPTGTLRILLAQHHQRGTDPDLGMHDALAGPGITNRSSAPKAFL